MTHQIIVAVMLTVAVACGFTTTFIYKKLRKRPNGWERSNSEFAWVCGIATCVAGSVPLIFSWLAVIRGEAWTDYARLGWYGWMFVAVVGGVGFLLEYVSEWRRRNDPPPSPWHRPDCDCCGIGGCDMQPPEGVAL